MMSGPMSGLQKKMEHITLTKVIAKMSKDYKMKRIKKQTITVEISGGSKQHVDTMAIELLLLLKKELQPWNRQVKKVEVKKNGKKVA